MYCTEDENTIIETKIIRNMYVLILVLENGHPSPISTTIGCPYLRTYSKKVKCPTLEYTAVFYTTMYCRAVYYTALHCIILHHNVLHYTRQECIHLPHNPLHPHPPPVRPLTNHMTQKMERNVEYSTEGLYLVVVSSHWLIEFLHKTSQTPPWGF